MKIGYNASAMLANNSLKQSDNAVSKSIQRLSSGLKINAAKDNPSGLAIAKRMKAQLRGIETAGDNVTNGISLIETADGALSEVHAMIQRMNELAVKASNETMSADDISIINDELQQLKDEVVRISDTTQFNGQNLLDGSFDFKGFSDDLDVKVAGYSDSVLTGNYNVKIDLEFDANGAVLETSEVTVDGVSAVDYEVKDNRITIKGDNGFELQLDLEISGADIAKEFSVELQQMGTMTLQIGANEGQTLQVRIPAITLKNMGIENTNTLTHEAATSAIGELNTALSYVSSVRSRLGAYQNRLDHTTNNLDVTNENMTAAHSRIMDVDMATEMTNYTSMQVISQAAISMIAQANERPSQALQLLQ